MTRRRFKREERESVFAKFCGKCAYCGTKLSFDSFQIDHIIAIERGGADSMDNLFPACRSCNHFKGTMTMETFREAVEAWPKVLMRDSVTYKNAVRFGLVIPNPHKIKFYFEQVMEEESK